MITTELMNENAITILVHKMTSLHYDSSFLELLMIFDDVDSDFARR